MQRRALLASIPASLTLAGCITPPSSSRDTTTTVTSGSDAAFTVTNLAVETETVAPTHRYLVRITKVYSADAVSREPGDPTVVDVSEVTDADVRSVLERVLSEGRIRQDTIPDGLREITERVDFFTWESTTDPDDTASHWAIEVFESDPEAGPALAFDAELADETVYTDDPGTITFRVENVGDETQEIFSGTVPPFGLLWADGPGGDRYLLWRDYTEEGCVSFTDEGHVESCDIGMITSVEPDETIERAYDIRLENPVGGSLRTGHYVVSETLGYEREPQGPRTAVEWRVSFTVEEA